MTSAREIEAELAEITGTSARDWGCVMAPCLVLSHPTAGEYFVYGDVLCRIVPFDVEQARLEQQKRAALAAPALSANVRANSLFRRKNKHLYPTVVGCVRNKRGIARS